MRATGARAWHAPETLLALLLAVCAVASVLDAVPRMVGIDYYLYWVVGSARAAHEIGDVYDAGEEERVGRMYLRRARQEVERAGAGAMPTRRFQAASVRARLDNYSTPFLYSVYGPLVSGSFERDFDRVNRASIALYFLGIVALCRVLGFSLTGTLIAVAALSIWFNPFIDDTSVGNVNRVQLGLIGAFVWLANARRLPLRHVAAGFVLGVALMFKPNLAHAFLALAIGWLATAQWRKLAQTAAGMALAAAACIAVSFAYFDGLTPWLRWMRKLPGLMPTWSSEAGVQSLARVLHDRLGVSIPGLLAPLFIGAVVALIVLSRAGLRRVSSSTDAEARETELGRWDVLLFSLGTLASVLSTKLVWQHYYVLAIPLALYLLRPPTGERPRRLGRSAALLALALVSVDLVMKLSAATADPALCVVVGALALFALGLADGLRSARAAHAHAIG